MMFRLVSAIGAIVGFGALAAIGLYFYLGLTRSEPILSTTRLPMNSTVVRIEIDTNSFNLDQFKPYQLVVETPTGSVASDLWHDWGPAGRVNLYRTSNDRLVVMGGGGFFLMISVNGRSGPQLVSPGVDFPTDDRDWLYLGAFETVSSGGRKQTRWFTPNELKECLPTFGEGRYAYRQSFQDIEKLLISKIL